MTVREQLERLIGLLVDHTDSVEVQESSDSDGTSFRLRVVAEDLGKVIGRQGRTARALRTVLGARQARGEGPYTLEILD